MVTVPWSILDPETKPLKERLFRFYGFGSRPAARRENTRFLDITLKYEGHIATVYTVIGSKDLRTPVFLHRQTEFVIKSARQT